MSKNEQSEGSQFVRHFGPLLDALRALGGSGTPDEVVEQVAKDENVSEDVLSEVLPSGELRFRNRVAWARFYLMREGLLDSSRRGIWSLTEKGQKTSLTHDEARVIHSKLNKIFQEERRKRKEAEPPAAEMASSDPGMGSEQGFRGRLLSTILALPPAGFERLCQRLLREAGFIQVFVTGRSGDGGIDGNGTLQVNPLVSFRVLFQCKRYKDSVTPSAVRDFRGAMQGRADKGIILTTGSFTADAKREAARDGVPPIELVDGEKLVDMFTNLELGLKPVKAYEIDDSFFAEFRGN